MSFSRVKFAGVALLAVLVVVPAAFGDQLASVTAIPPVPGKVGMLPTCITPDGKYVGGTSNIRWRTLPVATFQDPPGSGTWVNCVAFIWDVTNGTRTVTAGSVQATINGIGYRVMGDGSKQLVVGGFNAGWESMNYSTTEGASWAKARRTSTVAYPDIDPSGINTVAGSGGLNVYSTFKADDGTNLYIDGHDGTNWLTMGAKSFGNNTPRCSIMAISSAGVAVGSRASDTTPSYDQNCVFTYDGTGTLGATLTNGLAGDTKGKLYGIANDGSYAGGFSPVADGRPGLWPYVRNMTMGDLTELPVLVSSWVPTDQSSTAACVYGLSPDGKWAVGMDYTNGLEKAVLWDLNSLDNITVKDLTQLAIDGGIIGTFSGNLRRAYSCGIDNYGSVVISGIGVSSTEANGWTGFVAVYATTPRGACCVNHLGYRTCTRTIDADCPNEANPDTTTWTAGAACADVCPYCNIPWADADFDGDVDESDFGAIQACFTGLVAGVPVGCECLNRPIGGMTDSVINADDLAAFEKCKTGPMILLNVSSPPTGCDPGNGQVP